MRLGIDSFATDNHGWGELLPPRQPAPPLRENRRFAHAGMRLAKIAGATPFRTGKLLSE